MKTGEVLKGAWRYARKPTTIVATGALAIACSGSGEAKQGSTANTTTTSSRGADQEAKQPTTLPPTAGPDGYDPKEWQIIACYTKPAKIRPGDTVFGLTTSGLEPTETFKNRVFSWNLDEIQKQAEAKPALSNPNNIPIGTKFNILTDCVRISSAIADYDWDKDGGERLRGFTRSALFQNYTGTDGVTRHLVAVEYESDKQGNFYDPKTNDPYDVVACEPAPECYDYVGGAPEHPPKNAYIPSLD